MLLIRLGAQMDIAQEIKDRVLAAANALYEQGGRVEFPTVAAVRARASADMNAASLVMREWRRSQTAQPAPVAVEVPDKVRAANGVAMSVLWAEAQALANASLLTAQATWDAERAEAEALRGELSDAFENQRRELEEAQKQNEIQAEEIARRAAESEISRVELAKMTERAGTAEARATEIERRANDLAAELERVHAEGKVERERRANELVRLQDDRDQVRGDLAGVKASADAERQQHAEQRKTAAAETLRVAERMTKAEADRDQERRDAGKAREDAARLQGMVDAMTTQHSELMRAVVAAGEMRKAETPATGAAPASGKKKDQ